MKNNLIKKSLSLITIFAILNFPTPPTWAMEKGKEMRDLEKGRAKRLKRISLLGSPPLIPESNCSALNATRTYLLRSRRKVPEVPKSAPQQEVQQKKGMESAEEYTIPEPTHISLTQEPNKQEKKTGGSPLKVPENARSSFSFLNSPSFIPRSHLKGKKLTPEETRTQHNSERESNTKKWRSSLPSRRSSTTNMERSFSTREGSKQNEVPKNLSPRLQPISRGAAIDQGGLDETFQLAWNLFTGKEEIQDTKGAIRNFKIAAKEGHIGSMAALGHFYDQGIEVRLNYRKAMKWSSIPAMNGDAPSQYRLGDYFSHGLGVPADKKLGELWLKDAAEQEHLLAQVKLGELYLVFAESAEIAEQKYEYKEKALIWLKKAAERENQTAINLLTTHNKTIEDRKKSQNDEQFH